LDAAFKDPTQAKALQQLANDAVAAFAPGPDGKIDPTRAEGQLAADAQALLSASPLLGPIAQKGLSLPSLDLLPQIASNPALAHIASLLNGANLGHLSPLVAGGAQAAAAAPTPTATPVAAAAVASAPGA